MHQGSFRANTGKSRMRKYTLQKPFVIEIFNILSFFSFSVRFEKSGSNWYQASVRTHNQK